MANGNNIGRKQKDWKMVISSTHPHCRCALVQLPLGFYFNKNGQLTYIGEKDWSEVVRSNLSKG